MFDVGDIVRVIAEPPIDKHGKHWVYTPDMEDRCGQEATITQFTDRYRDGCRGYKLDIGPSDCLYEEKWLIPVKVLEQVTKEQFDEDFGALVSGVF